MGDIFILQMGKTPLRENKLYWDKGNYNWISISDMNFSEKYISFTKEKITDFAIKKSGIKIIPKNTVIMSFKLSIGKVKIVNEDIYSNEAIMAFIPKEDIFIDENFLYHSLKSVRWNEGINKAVKGLTLNKNLISQKEIFLPDLTTQKEITNNLDTIDNLLELRKKQLNYLKELGKSLFTRMFGDIRNNSFNWKQVKLQDVCSSIVRGPFGSSLKKEFFVKNGYKVYEQKNAIKQSANLGEYYIDEKKFKELQRFECKVGDIIMSCSGTVGKLFQLPENSEKGIINQALCKFSLNNKIKSTYFLKYLEKVIGNIELNGSGIKNISSVSYIKKIDINLPPIELQNKFAERVEKIEKLSFDIEKSIKEAENLYNSLMNKYFE
ncbi:restriction endonuclease subunit S [Fusobacterium nucleatum]|nr:restriction endonuclease subunit S [Fusobacterium nucleatum]BEP02001.1 restriction endonuclease subunit S [Fusobacterium nucleatum]